MRSVWRYGHSKPHFNARALTVLFSRKTTAVDVSICMCARVLRKSGLLEGVVALQPRDLVQVIQVISLTIEDRSFSVIFLGAL